MNFNAFEQSPFLQSLGWAITNNVWQAGICWGLYHIVISSYSGVSSKVKNNVSTIFLFSTFLWFIITFFIKFIYLQNNISEVVPRQVIFSLHVSSVSNTFDLQTFTHSLGITLPYLSVGYLLLLLFFTTRLINSYRNTIFIRHNGLQKPAVEWKLFVGKGAENMSITKKIELWFSKHVDVPATIGFFKPVILVPIASVNQLTADQLEAILLHELSHIKRNDYLINLFISLIETILFFNPFIVLLSKIIKKERENCCDDFVLQYQYDRHSYASALLSLERYRIQNLPLALAATSNKKQLLFRIKRIMEVKNNTNSLNYGQKLIALLLTTTIIFSIAWLSPVKKLNQRHGKQLGENFRRTKLEINKEQHTFLRLEDQPKINSVESQKLIKEKSGKLKLTHRNDDFFKESKEDLFTWKADEIENNAELPVDNNSRIFIAPNLRKAPAGPKVATNFAFISSTPLPDLKFFQDVTLDMDLKALVAEIETSNQSLSLMNWETIPKGIFDKLKSIKIPLLKIVNDQNQNDLIIDRPKKDESKNRHNDGFRFTLINSDKNNNIPTWKVTTNSGDFISPKDMNISNVSDDNERSFFERHEKTPPALNQPSIYFSEDISLTNAYLKNKVEKKLSPKQSIQIDYKKGIVTINGKKISFSDIKTHQAQAFVEKLLLNCNKQIVKQTADL